MNRKERLAKAGQVRKAIASMKSNLKTASGQQRIALLEDIDVAMDDYMNYIDDDYWMDEGMEDDFMHHDDMMDHGADSMDFMEEDDMIEGMEEDFMHHAGEGDVPMGAMDDHTNVYAAQELENRKHISYILDKVADVVASIESYEKRAKAAGKQPKSAGARKRIAGYMKELASVVAKSNLRTASVGNRLSSVGVKVVAMHKQLVKAR